MQKSGKKKILIIGGGRRGLATVEILNEDENFDIIAVVDKKPNASGVKLAQRLGIKTDTDWEKYIEESELDAVLNLTGDKKIQDLLHKKAQDTGIEIPGGTALEFLSNILMERQVQVELHRVSQRITSDIELDELLVLILSSCVKGTKAAGGLIILKDDKSGNWEVKSRWEVPDKFIEEMVEIATKKLYDWDDKKEVEKLFDNPAEDLNAVLKTALCAPLRFRGDIIGAIVVFKKEGKSSFSPQLKRLLSTFANQSAVAIENVLLYKKSQHLSITDGLTGVYNHRYFQDKLATELSRAQRYDLNFGLIIFDLDNFKNINDTHGHVKGDEILKRVAYHIEKVLRKSDTIARYGGDEFVALLPETRKKDTIKVGERIRQSLERANEESEVAIHISVGVAAYPDDGVYREDLVKKADGALYKAKESGRNKTCAA
ncbi:MAG: diguanylate cyclase [Elusimicrobiota bacterium]